MSTTPSIRATPPAKAIAAMARKTTPDEIARVTGWDIKAVRAAIRAGELPGCRFVPSGVSATSGSYLCAWAPFVRWFRDGVEPAAAPKDETQRFLHHIKTLDTIQNLIESEIVQVASSASAGLGLDATPIRVPYGSDASKFHESGIPTIVFGPGSIASAHAIDEHVPVDELVTAAEFYREVALRFGTGT